MRVYGLDFTSAPGPRKPITLAACTLGDGVLTLVESHALDSFAAFEDWLETPGPWIAGIDFPFGQPRKLIENLGWPNDWASYVRRVAELGKDSFADTLASYRRARPSGDRHHFRAVDRPARACSPMMLFGVPVGRMFAEGAPRLLRSSACVLPFEALRPERGIVVEAYPGLVARTWISARSYKSDTRRKQTAARRDARRALVERLCSDDATRYYGFELELSTGQADGLVTDPSGDRLDALLCALHAGWAYTRRDDGYGIPPRCDALEGWIADPALARRDEDSDGTRIMQVGGVRA